MRRNWKRLLSLLLTVAMVFTMNTAVFADITDGDTDDPTTVANWTANPETSATATANDEVAITSDEDVTLTAEAEASAIKIDASNLAKGKSLTVEGAPDGTQVKVPGDGSAIKISGINHSKVFVGDYSTAADRSLSADSSEWYGKAGETTVVVADATDDDNQKPGYVKFDVTNEGNINFSAELYNSKDEKVADGAVSTTRDTVEFSFDEENLLTIGEQYTVKLNVSEDINYVNSDYEINKYKSAGSDLEATATIVGSSNTGVTDWVLTDGEGNDVSSSKAVFGDDTLTFKENGTYILKATGTDNNTIKMKTANNNDVTLGLVGNSFVNCVDYSGAGSGSIDLDVKDENTSHVDDATKQVVAFTATSALVELEPKVSVGPATKSTVSFNLSRLEDNVKYTAVLVDKDGETVTDTNKGSTGTGHVIVDGVKGGASGAYVHNEITSAMKNITFDGLVSGETFYLTLETTGLISANGYIYKKLSGFKSDEATTNTVTKTTVSLNKVDDFKFPGLAKDIKSHFSLTSSTDVGSKDVAIIAAKESVASGIEIPFIVDDGDVEAAITAADNAYKTAFKSATTPNLSSGWAFVSDNSVVWDAGDYVAIAYYPGDGDAMAASANAVKFTIDPALVYLKPEYNGAKSPKVGQTLTASDFSLNVYSDAAGNTVSENLSVAAGSDVKYYLNGEEVKSEGIKLENKAYTVSANVTTAALDTATSPDNKANYAISANDAGEQALLTSTLSIVNVSSNTIAVTAGTYADKFYYGTKLTAKNITNYAVVKNGGAEVKSSDVEWYYSTTETGTKSLISNYANYTQNYNKGQKIYIWPKVLDNFPDKPLVLEVIALPIEIEGVDTVQSVRHSELVDKYYDDVLIWPVDVSGNRGSVDISDGVRKNIKALQDEPVYAQIDTTGIDKETVGVYEDVPMFISSLSINKLNKDSNYEITKATIDNYQIVNAVKIKVLNANTGAQLSVSENYTYVVDNTTKVAGDDLTDAAGKPDLSHIGTDTLTISVNTPKDMPDAWYIKSSETGGMFELKLGTDYTVNTPYTYKIDFDLSALNKGTNKDYRIGDNTDTFTIYGVYNPPITNTTTKSKTAIGTLSADYIAPVVYDGNKHVEENDTTKKGLTKDLEVSVYVYTEGVDPTPLTKGVDYKLSYKNNVNAAYSTDKKAPQVIVTGIGQYKGQKLTIPFTILPQNFNEASAKVKTTIIANNKKGEPKINVTVKIGSKAVNKSFYKIEYYTMKGAKLTAAQIAEYFDGTKKGLLEAYAKVTSINPKNKSVNFTIGDSAWVCITNSKGNDEPAELLIYPKGSKSMNVKLNDKGKYSYSTTQKTLGLSKVATSANVVAKVGKVNVAWADLDNKNFAFYSDKNLTQEVADPITNAGTYYLKVALKDAKTMVKYEAYKPAVVKVVFQAPKITKKDISLTTTKLAATGTRNKAIALTSGTLVAGTDFILKGFDAYGNEYPIAVNGTTGKYTFDYNNNDDGTYEYTDNGTGKYKVVVYGQGAYSGKLNYTYSYAKSSAKSLGVTATIPAQKFNAAGYDNSIITLKDSYGSVLAKSGAYEIDSVIWNVNKVGENAGIATIKFKNLTGSVKANFTVNPIAITDASIKVSSNSVYSGDAEKKSNAYLYMTNGSKVVKLSSKDYKLSAPSQNTATQYHVVATVPAKGSRLTANGTRTITYSVYPNKVTNIKITGLSSNTGYTGSAKVVYDSKAKAYKFQGGSAAVMPAVISVTATVDSSKNTVIPASAYDVVYTPVLTKVLDPEGNFDHYNCAPGTYKVTITIKDSVGTAYPSGATATYSYKVSQ